MGTLRTHVLLPLAASLLPWSAGYALLRRAARSGAARFADEEPALASARALGVADDTGAWLVRYRAVQLVDHADLYLSRLRSDAWLARHAVIEGRWPERGPFLAVTYHWGAGLWALRHLSASGHRARFLSGRFSRADFAPDTVRFRYVEARIRATERASGAPVIYTGGATAEILATLAAGTSVVALCDVPVQPGRAALEVPMLGRRLRLPAGLARLACRERVPVVVFHGGVEEAAGRRRIAIGSPTLFTDPRAMAEHLARVLASLLREDAPAWHMWPHAGALLP